MLQAFEDQDIQLAMAKIEIVSYFNANPHTRDTVEGFSKRLLLDVGTIRDIMDELIHLNILEKHGTNCAVYRLKVSYSTLNEFGIS